nr:MAG TPA: hypothetical protein [Caudoviricetes sp.]
MLLKFSERRIILLLTNLHYKCKSELFSFLPLRYIKVIFFSFISFRQSYFITVIYSKYRS